MTTATQSKQLLQSSVLKDTLLFTECMKCENCQKIVCPTELSGCRGGHFLCTKCILPIVNGKTVAQNCPCKLSSGVICKAITFGFNSELYTYFYNNTAFKCAYGCTATPPGVDYKYHCCSNRKALICPVSDCNAPPTIPEYLGKHMVDFHKITVTLANCGRIITQYPELNGDPVPSLKEVCWGPRIWASAIFFYEGLHFVLMTREGPEKIHMWIWAINDCSLVGARRFGCRICLIPSKHTVLRFTNSWTGIVHSMWTPQNEIIDEQADACLTFDKTRLLDEDITLMRLGQYCWMTDVQIEELEPCVNPSSLGRPRTEPSLSIKQLKKMVMGTTPIDEMIKTLEPTTQPSTKAEPIKQEVDLITFD